MPQIKSAFGHAVYADAISSLGVLDVHAAARSKNLILSSEGMDVRDSGTQNLLGGTAMDFTTWLPYAAPEYVISPNPEDYVLTPVPTVPTELPNRNCVGFPIEELLKFNVDAGRMAYKTFIGKPLHIEHDNQDPLKAIGVIVDAVLRPTPGFGGGRMKRIVKLLAVDRTKRPDIAQKILNREINTWSMGAWVQSFKCSYCDAAFGKCNHLSVRNARDFYELNSKLVYRLCVGINGFETSVVFDPAWSMAASDMLFNL